MRTGFEIPRVRILEHFLEKTTIVKQYKVSFKAISWTLSSASKHPINKAHKDLQRGYKKNLI